MNEFCRIIPVSEGQVLLTMDFDDEADLDEGKLKVTQMTEYNGARMSVTAGYKTKDLQLKHFKDFRDKDAQKFFNTAKKMLS